MHIHTFWWFAKPPETLRDFIRPRYREGFGKFLWTSCGITEPSIWSGLCKANIHELNKMSHSTQKNRICLLSPLMEIRVGIKLQKQFFARRCLGLHYKVIFSNPPTPWRVGEGQTAKTFLLEIECFGLFYNWFDVGLFLKFRCMLWPEYKYFWGFTSLCWAPNHLNFVIA